MPSLLPVQAAFAIVGLPVAATWPPAAGDILLVPVTAGAGQRLAAEAVKAGGTLVARGPLPGSLVVRGERARLRDIDGTLLLSATAAGCGTRP